MSEPESVQMFREMAENEDRETLNRIWKDFRFKCSTQDMSFDVLDGYILLAIDTVKEKVRTEPLKSQAVAHLEGMRKGVASVAATESDDAICPKCQMKRFICPCPKE